MLKKTIAINPELGEVSLAADYLFTRCLPHLDVEGRMIGEPGRVRALVCPNRPEMTPAMVASCLAELARVGLVLWYAHAGARFLAFPGFHRQQQLRRDREAPSRIPAPPAAEGLPDYSGTTPGALPEDSRTTPGALPDHSRIKSSQVNSPSGGADAPAEAEQEPAREAIPAAAPAKQPKAPKQPSAPKAADPAKAAPWMGLLNAAWRARFGGRCPEQTVKILRPVVEEIGPEEAAARFGRWLAEQELKFVNVERFAMGHGSYASAGTDTGSPARALAERMAAAFDATGLLRARTAGGVADAAAEVAAQLPEVPDADRVVALVKLAGRGKLAAGRAEQIEILTGALTTAASEGWWPTLTEVEA